MLPLSISLIKLRRVFPWRGPTRSRLFRTPLTTPRLTDMPNLVGPNKKATTGPFCPLRPRWIWAWVTLEILLTTRRNLSWVPLVLRWKTALPVAIVLTGGTSLRPDKKVLKVLISFHSSRFTITLMYSKKRGVDCILAYVLIYINFYIYKVTLIIHKYTHRFWVQVKDYVAARGWIFQMWRIVCSRNTLMIWEDEQHISIFWVCEKQLLPHRVHLYNNQFRMTH